MRATRYYRDPNHPWVKAQRFTDTCVDDLLRLPTKRSALGKPVAWLLDLDSTLFSTSPRTKAVFGAFLRAHLQPPFHWQWLYANLNSANQRYKIDETFQAILQGLDRDRAEVWAKELWAEFEPFWFEHFFGENFLIHDEAHAGAPAFVERVLALGHEVIYLTARERMRSSFGTRDTLRAHGFPLGQGTHLVMKYSKESDLVFKGKAADVLRQRFNVHAVIDNEPENLVMFANAFPDALVVFYHSVMSHREPKILMKDVLGPRPLYRIYDFE